MIGSCPCRACTQSLDLSQRRPRAHANAVERKKRKACWEAPDCGSDTKRRLELSESGRSTAPFVEVADDDHRRSAHASSGLDQPLDLLPAFPHGQSKVSVEQLDLGAPNV